MSQLYELLNKGNKCQKSLFAFLIFPKLCLTRRLCLLLSLWERLLQLISLQSTLTWSKGSPSIIFTCFNHPTKLCKSVYLLVPVGMPFQRPILTYLVWLPFISELMWINMVKKKMDSAVVDGNLNNLNPLKFLHFVF